ncbi:DUF3800 domain-containing protein [Dehalococcoidales bacterium]|nr:DUF3800 domain-containing protein [Dehalococcoidales bacterium]
MYVYLDESGDLGFGQGGTRYFTIAFVIMKDPIPFRRCVKQVKIKHHIPREVELRGNTTREVIKKDLLSRFQRLDLEIHAITVNKKNVEPKLRKDTNILYNYMVGLSLVERILEEPKEAKVVINVDRRIIAITAGFKFNEYLRYKIWYEKERRDISLNIHHLDSHQAYTIQGIDVICNSIFKKYNSNNYKLFNIIQDKVKSDRRLFFGK